MNADILTTTVADGIAVITLGNAKRIFFDAEMGDDLTEALDRFAGDPSIRVVVVTGGAPGYFIRHFDIPRLSGSQSPCALPVANGQRTPYTTGDSSTRPWRYARACQSPSLQPYPAPPWPVPSSSRSRAIFVSRRMVTT